MEIFIWIWDSEGYGDFGRQAAVKTAKAQCSPVFCRAFRVPERAAGKYDAMNNFVNPAVERR